ncbi:MAG: alpha/beta fold hydrolase [Myxococcales bacterium]
MARPSGRDPASHGVAFSAVELRTDEGLMLSAWWVPGPSSSATLDLVAVVHPFHSGHKSDVLPWVKLLHELGLGVVAIDGRGHGDSDPVPAGTKDSLAARAHDVAAACNEARRRGARRLLLVGQSQGGGVPVLVEASRRGDVAAVVVESGPGTTMLDASLGLAKFALAGTRSKPSRLALMMCCARILHRGRPIVDTWAQWRSLVRLRSRPLLWIHGERDAVVPLASAARWFGALGKRGGQWHAVIIPRGRHAACVPMGTEQVRLALRELNPWGAASDPASVLHVPRP